MMCLIWGGLEDKDCTAIELPVLKWSDIQLTHAETEQLVF